MGVDFDHVFSYHAPTEEQITKYGSLRTQAKVLAQLIERLVLPGADCSAAMRLLRECIMTANAGIALDGRINKLDQNI